MTLAHRVGLHALILVWLLSLGVSAWFSLGSLVAPPKTIPEFPRSLRKTEIPATERGDLVEKEAARIYVVLADEDFVRRGKTDPRTTEQLVERAFVLAEMKLKLDEILAAQSAAENRR